MTAITVIAAFAGDDGERVEQFVRTIGGLDRPDARVLVAHVYAEDDLDRLEEMLDVDRESPGQLDVAAEHNTAVEELSSELVRRDVDHETRGRVGDPASTIVSLADEEDADFVLVGGGDRSPTGKALFGSTAQSILLNAPCPVVLVK